MCLACADVVSDTTPFIEVLNSYRKGDEEMQTRLSRVEKRFREDMRGSMAMLALMERRSKVLKDCLEGGFIITSWFIKAADEAEALNDDVETIKVIQDSRIRNARDEFRELEERRAKIDSSVFDKGGKFEVDW